MSPAPRRCSPPPRRRASRASSMSPRSPRASRSCRSTARARRGRKRWSPRSPLSTGRSSARPRSMAPATARRSSCSRWRSAGWSCCRRAGRLSLIHVDDLARLLLALAAPDAPSELLIEPDDGRAGGWTHREFGQALGRAVGRRGAARLSAPRALLTLAARADRLVRGDKAKLTADRAAYFCHPDWAVDAGRAAPPDLWQPRIATDAGPRRDRALVSRRRAGFERPPPSLRPIALRKPRATTRDRSHDRPRRNRRQDRKR